MSRGILHTATLRYASKRKHCIHRILPLIAATSAVLLSKSSGATAAAFSSDHKSYPICQGAAASMTPSGVPKRNWGVIEPVSYSDPANPTANKFFRVFLRDDGTFPNHPHHPVIIARSAFDGTTQQAQDRITHQQKWTSPWIWGIFPYHHYHSTAWELLLGVEGHATIQLGGPDGPELLVQKGDLLLIPPGVAHKQLHATHDFALLGSYPTSGGSGSVVDTLRGAPTDQQRANIQACLAPASEPILQLDLSQFYQPA